LALNGASDSASGPGLRLRKRSQTKADLTEAALELFRTRGFRATSVDDIAAAAGVSRSTFFRYFGSKEGVLFARGDDVAKEMMKRLIARPPSEGPLQAFEEVLVDLARERAGTYARESETAFNEMLRSDATLRIKSFMQTDRWIRVLADCFARRRQDDSPIGPEDRLAAATCAAVAEQISNEWRQSDVEAEDAIRAAFAALRRMTAGGSS